MQQEQSVWLPKTLDELNQLLANFPREVSIVQFRTSEIRYHLADGALLSLPPQIQQIHVYHDGDTEPQMFAKNTFFGMIYSAQKNDKLALQSYNMQVGINNQDCLAWCFIAEISYSQKEISRAKEICGDVLKIKPHFEFATQLLAHIAIDEKDPKALDLLEMLKKKIGIERLAQPAYEYLKPFLIFVKEDSILPLARELQIMLCFLQKCCSICLERRGSYKNPLVAVTVESGLSEVVNPTDFQVYHRRCLFSMVLHKPKTRAKDPNTRLPIDRVYNL